LVAEVKDWQAKFEAKLRELNEPLQQEMQANTEKVNKALNKKTEDQQKELAGLDGPPGGPPGKLPKLRKEVQELWVKVEGLIDIEDIEDEELEAETETDPDVDELIAEVEGKNDS
jgi:hypothetical protein